MHSSLYALWMLAPACRGIQALLSKAVFKCTAGLTKELLQGVPAGLPRSKVMDYWATLSSCLTELHILMDPVDRQPLQPSYLNQLTRLTRLEFGASDPNGDWTEAFQYAFKLPALQVLCVDCLGASDLQLQCPQLQTLRIERFSIGKLHLRASLEHLHYADGGDFSIHEGFPITNLTGLTYLSLDVSYDTVTEAALLQGLPLMIGLHVLDMRIGSCGLPAILPGSLRDITLSFSYHKAWDSSVIPLLQQLPGVESIRVHPLPQGICFLGDESLDCDLRPFLAIKSLKLLQLGDSQVWKASALRQLGDFEAEIVRSGKKLQLRY